MLEVEIPEFQIMTENIAPEGQPPVWVMKLLVSTSGTMCQFFMGSSTGRDKLNYQRIAQSWREMIMRAGSEMNSKAGGLIEMKGMPDGLRKGK